MPVDYLHWVKFSLILFRPFRLNFSNFPFWQICWIMEHNWQEHNEDVTVVSNPKRILHDGRRTADASRTATPVGNRPIAPHSLLAVLKKLDAPIPWSEEEDIFDALADRLCQKNAWQWKYIPLSVSHQPRLRIQCANRMQVCRLSWKTQPCKLAVLQNCYGIKLGNRDSFDEPNSRQSICHRGLPELWLSNCSARNSTEIAAWDTSCQWPSDAHYMPPGLWCFSGHMFEERGRKGSC